MPAANPSPLDDAQRFAPAVEALRQAVLATPGATEPAARKAAASGQPLPAPLAEYAAKVRDASFRITDETVAALLAGGQSQDAVFELTVAAAFGAAEQRLLAGLRALQTAG